jgi:outer membrane scaffolding protein for murein synthesis (MipA/OmpV family)
MYIFIEKSKSFYASPSARQSTRQSTSNKKMSMDLNSSFMFSDDEDDSEQIGNPVKSAPALGLNESKEEV